MMRILWYVVLAVMATAIIPTQQTLAEQSATLATTQVVDTLVKPEYWYGNIYSVWHGRSRSIKIKFARDGTARFSKFNRRKWAVNDISYTVDSTGLIQFSTPRGSNITATLYGKNMIEGKGTFKAPRGTILVITISLQAE